MKLSEAKARREAVIARELAIVAELAEMKRAWIVDKIEGSFATRTTLEAELASLAVEKFAATSIIVASKKAEKAYQHALSAAILVRLLNERGLGELVVEANRLAVDAGIERS